MILENGFILSFPENLAFDDDALLAFCEANSELRIERDENKQLIIISPNSLISGVYHNIILKALNNWNEDEKGMVLDSSVGFRLPDSSVRAADVAWLSMGQWKSLSEEQKKRFASICPAFIVEVRSPSDSWQQLNDKMEAWIKNGAQLGWLIDVDQELAVVYTSSSVLEVSDFSQVLNGADVLLGFEFELSSLKNLWPVPLCLCSGQPI